MFIAVLSVTWRACVAQSDTDHDIAALLAGMRGYDQTIDSVEWQQRWYAPPTSAMKRHRWVLGELSSRHRDSNWHWLHISSFFSTNPPEYRIEYRDSVYFGNGCTRIAAGPEGGWKGIITNQDIFFVGAATLETLLGRTLDYGRSESGRSVTELFEVSESIEFMPPSESEPWPGVRCVGSIGRGWSNLEVRADPSRQFMPRLMRVVRRSDGAIGETIVIVGDTEVDGVWLPRLGVRSPMYTEVLDPEHDIVSTEVSGDFALALRLDGLPEMLDIDRARLRQWIEHGQRVRWIDEAERIAEGPLAWSSREVGPIAPIVVFIDHTLLNTTIHFDVMMSRYHEGTTVFSGYTWRRGSLRDEVRIWEAWGPRVVGREEEAAP